MGFYLRLRIIETLLINTFSVWFISKDLSGFKIERCINFNSSVKLLISYITIIIFQLFKTSRTRTNIHSFAKIHNTKNFVKNVNHTYHVPQRRSLACNSEHSEREILRFICEIYWLLL